MHPYITSAIIMTLIVLAVGYSIRQTCRRWSAQREERKQRQELYKRVRELSTKVQTLKDNQKVILKDQKEVLKILKGTNKSNESTQTDEN